MPESILNLPGRVNANGALVVTGGSGATTGSVGTIATLPGKVDSVNRLVVRVVNA